MKRSHTLLVAVSCALSLAWPASAQRSLAEKVDLDAVYRIKDEGLQRSKVMETASYLTDVYGPRLAGSPNYNEAAAWAEKTLQEWGLVNVHRESFPFGRGWQNQRFVAMVTSPRIYPLIGFPRAWTPGTNGPITGEAVLAVVQSERDFDTWRGKLRGKFVLTTQMRAVPARFEPLARRFSDNELADLARQPSTAGRGRGTPPANGAPNPQEFARKRAAFFADEKVAALLEPSPNGDGGTFFVQSAANVTRDPKEALQAPQIVLSIEHYGRIFRTLEKKLPVTLQVDVDNRFYDDDLNTFNVLAEIPGSDKAGEVVMLGAHFDSWQAGTGATDNAAGSAVMMEAMRILKASGLRLRRTVRLALWGAEEEGLIGSAAYVKAHFADRTTMQLQPEHARLSAYFNVDNGTGAIRGVYLQGHEAVAPIFESWMEPFRNLGMTTLAIRNTGGTDHTSFDAVGLPGFQFIQDPVDYDSRTHHSNEDLYERIQPDDMMRNAVIVAAFVYNAANRDEQLPRKPLPKPQPAGHNGQ
jgi:carboxypeptidase Q